MILALIAQRLGDLAYFGDQAYFAYPAYSVDSVLTFELRDL